MSRASPERLIHDETEAEYAFREAAINMAAFLRHLLRERIFEKDELSEPETTLLAADVRRWKTHAAFEQYRKRFVIETSPITSTSKRARAKAAGKGRG